MVGCVCPSGERCSAGAQKKLPVFGSFKRCGLCDKRKPFRRTVECKDCGFVYHRRCQKRADCENGATDLSSVSDLSPVAAVNCENETDSSPAAANSEYADDLSSADVEGDRKVTAVQTTDDESSSNSVPTTCRPLVTLGDAIILTTFGRLSSVMENRRDETVKHWNALDRGNRMDPFVVHSKFAVRADYLKTPAMCFTVTETCRNITKILVQRRRICIVTIYVTTAYGVVTTILLIELN